MDDLYQQAAAPDPTDGLSSVVGNPIASIWSIFESPIHKLGLRHPLTRALFFFSLASAAIVMTKPSFAFDSKGFPKKFLSETSVPWWMPGLFLAVFFGLFV